MSAQKSNPERKNVIFFISSGFQSNKRKTFSICHTHNIEQASGKEKKKGTNIKGENKQTQKNYQNRSISFITTMSMDSVFKTKVFKKTFLSWVGSYVMTILQNIAVLVHENVVISDVHQMLPII